ncbi:Predicted O-methyltransferase YrrM [Modestobacter sp. DSM 44400]|uniref:O-methyltransferase n=1 Tax=Modestobacter sp. DSM 44400 TaxID=1550230 RepID=UPI00089BEE56|nr:O-methyltransferase [Modestobacter sp. DSM 44400]SDY87573.1 Predicted O-methyltransferase YrrM [Modestobacter sp. DSM 44400]
MYESTRLWREVDDYFVGTLVAEDEALVQTRTASHAAGLPPHEVAPNQGALLALLARAAGARCVLEVGTLAGYSTIWLARAVGPDGRVTTLELDPEYAALARANLERAGVADRVEIVVGPAVDSLAALVDAGAEPFDLVFLDADKPNNPGYLDAALQLTRPGSLIVADNVVRDGAVVDADSTDERVRGVRRFLRMLAEHPHLEATALQTVGTKGWDGFALALVH